MEEYRPYGHTPYGLMDDFGNDYWGYMSNQAVANWYISMSIYGGSTLWNGFTAFEV